MNRHVRLLIFLGLVLALSLFPHTAAQTDAQTAKRCFPETGHCISGRIREFWEQNGGLPVFGLPIGPQREEQIEGKPFQVQWFERNRLELHPENARPYDVLIGRLGADRLQQQGRDWFTFPKSEPKTDCRFFSETGHNICGAFLQAWRTNGLALDRSRKVSEAESLGLFGLPLSDEQTETIEGKEYTVQWFERARFEFHPENQPPYNVLLGRLGAELLGSIEPPPPAPGSGIKLYVCSDDTYQALLVESCTIKPGTSTQFFIYPDFARDFGFSVPRTISGSSFTFKLWLGSIGATNMAATLLLRHNDEEKAVAASSFNVTSNIFREFTQTVGGNLNAQPGDTLILRISSSAGEKAALLIANDAASTITITP